MDWPLFANVPQEHVQQLLSLARPRKFSRGEVVFHRGDPADTMHLVAAGRFAVRAITPRGDSAVLSILATGDFFGEMALLEHGSARSATVAALEPARTVSIHQIDFAALRKKHPQVSDVLIAALAQQVRRLTEQLVDALFTPVDRRVLLRLHELADMYRDAHEIPIPLTQEEIAELAGTSRATVNRVLRQAEEHGVIRLGRGRVTVLDADRLGELAGRRTLRS